MWANPELFLLDEQHRPRFVAGVPPDYFSAQGQLWGNPIYNWDALRRTGYRWCIDRLRALLAHVDVIRLDHFRGFRGGLARPGRGTTAQAGQWLPGPGAEFFSAVQQELGALPFIAEDLGLITPDVYALRDHSTCLGRGSFCSSLSTAMKITRICRTTTSPIRWCTPAPMTMPRHAAGMKHCRMTSGRPVALPAARPAGASDEAAWELIRLAWSSVAALAIAPLQDVLNLGAEARMNVPGRAEGNWRWRCTADMLSARPSNGCRT